MKGERVQGKLAAILAGRCRAIQPADGEDEESTLARLKAHRRELIEPKTVEHHGRIVKTTGDGLLIEFPSVVEAVSCALAVQQAMAELNAETRRRSSVPSASASTWATLLPRAVTSTATGSLRV